MERLTMDNGLCQMARTEFCLSQKDCYFCPHGRKCFKRLAAYEDTGLEPEDIDALRKREQGLAEFLVQVSCGCDVSYTRLTELAQAEKDGRLVVLPCKVGDRLPPQAGGGDDMKTTGTPCGSCKHFSDGRCPIGDWCISNEDIVLAVMNPKHPVDFTRYEPKEDRS